MPIGTIRQDEQQERTFKSYALVAVASCFFVLLFARLFYVQVVQADLNMRLSVENQMQVRAIKAPRGRLYDRSGELLALNRPSYSLCVLPYKLKDKSDVIDRLCRIRGRNGEAVFDSASLSKLFRQARNRKFDATRIKEDVPFDVVSVVEEHSMDLPGVVVEIESRREYPLSGACFHVLGYMAEIPEDEFGGLEQQGYHYGDLVGKAGIEAQYEEILRGKDGQEYIEVNAYGKAIGAVPNMPRAEPVPGNDMYLSIDARLQRVARASFPDSLKGAVVALDPRSGEVLLMFSNPAVDPNIFSLSSNLRSKSWAAVATDPELPLNNRATAGTYSPGSTFKLVTATAGLASGKLNPHSYMPRACGGSFRIGRRVAHCWKLDGHGRLDLTHAVQQSCNVFFYQAGLLLGDDLINRYARLLGLGERSGIDIPNEKTGWLSGEEEYNKRFAKRGWKWTTGLVCDLAIGQAQVVTPIQLAMMAGALGNGHSLYRPCVVKEIRDQDGAVVRLHSPEKIRDLGLGEPLIEAMRAAMEEVTNAGGTAGRARVPGVRVGGKTGSAQNPQGEKTHALFAGCAPIDNPRIAIAAVVENAGHGGTVAAPIVGDILRYYFQEIEKISPPPTPAVAKAQPKDSVRQN